MPTCLLPRQPGKRAIDLIIDFLSCLWDYAKQQITREIGAVADLGLYLPLCGKSVRVLTPFALYRHIQIPRMYGLQCQPHGTRMDAR